MQLYYMFVGKLERCCKL